MAVELRRADGEGVGPTAVPTAENAQGRRNRRVASFPRKDADLLARPLCAVANRPSVLRRRPRSPDGFSSSASERPEATWRPMATHSTISTGTAGAK